MAGTLTVDTLKASSGVLATQNGMTGIAKAWCNFNGTSGATAINTGFNFSSITRNGAGDYSFSFTTAMPVSTYSVVFGGDTANNSRGVTIFIHDGATAIDRKSVV